MYIRGKSKSKIPFQFRTGIKKLAEEVAENVLEATIGPMEELLDGLEILCWPHHKKEFLFWYDDDAKEWSVSFKSLLQELTDGHDPGEADHIIEGLNRMKSEIDKAIKRLK